MTFNFEKRFAQVGEVISFRAKNQKGSTITVYARVLNKEFKPYRGWAMGSIAAGASSAFAEIMQATTGGYYLRPDANNLVGHYYVGVYPNHCRVNWQYPLGQKIGQLRDLSLAGDAAGALFGDWLPYNDPSDAIEFITLSGVTTPAFSVTNDSGEAQTFRLNFIGCFYEVQWLDMKLNEDRQLIGQAASLGLVRCIPFGGVIPCSLPSWLLSWLSGNEDQMRR